MANRNHNKDAKKAAKREVIRHNMALLIYAMREFGLHGERKEFIFKTVAESIGLPWPYQPGGYAVLQKFWDADPKHQGQAPRDWHRAVKKERRAISAPWAQRAKEAKASKPRVQAKPNVNSDEFLLSFEWRKLRMVVLKKRGARCECCGSTPAHGIVIHVDHIKPRRRFPELALVESNLQVLCEVCNHGKGSWDDTDWRAVSQTSIESLESPVNGTGDGDGQKPVVLVPRLVRGDVKRASG